jgi:hypothetical protein
MAKYLTPTVIVAILLSIALSIVTHFVPVLQPYYEVGSDIGIIWLFIQYIRLSAQADECCECCTCEECTEE